MSDEIEHLENCIIDLVSGLLYYDREVDAAKLTKALKDMGRL